MQIQEPTEVPTVPAPASFAVDQIVRDGAWAAIVLAPPCSRGFVPVSRIYDDEGRYHVVHESSLVATALTDDEAQLWA